MTAKQADRVVDPHSVEEKVQELKEIAQREMRELQVPGVAVGLTVNGLDYTFGFGITHIENPLEITSRTLFRIGSTTKTITGQIIMMLVDQGKVNLDDKVRKYLPNFKVQDEYASANVTVRQLLNHTAGWDGDIFFDTGSGDDALEKYVAKMAEVGQQTPLGELFTYNNASLNIAGRIIEVVTGKTYEDAVQDMVLNPLGMDNSFFSLGEVMMHRFAMGHMLKDGKLEIGRPYAESRASAACGGLISDAVDQMKYARFHMGDGRTPSGERLLSEQSMRLMQTPVIDASGDTWIGITWHINDVGGVRIVSHGGSTVGQQSAFWMAPAEKVAMTVLTNQDGGIVLHERLCRWVQEHFLGAVEILPEPLILSETELAEYTGDYVMAQTGDVFTVTPKDGVLVMTHTVGDYSGVFDTPPDPYPPMRMGIYEPNHYIFIDDPFKDLKGGFLRGPNGKVVWMSIGGRILKKR